MPEDTARRLAEIREAFDCSVADYGMDPGDTGFLLDIIDALTAERDAFKETMRAIQAELDSGFIEDARNIVDDCVRLGPEMVPDNSPSPVEPVESPAPIDGSFPTTTATDGPIPATGLDLIFGRPDRRTS